MNHSIMSQIAGWLAPHLPLVLAAMTLLLAIGGLCLALVRSPAHRQRVGELTLAAVLGWLVLAAIPLPRWLPASGVEGGAIAGDGQNGNSRTAPAYERSMAERVTAGPPPAESIVAGPNTDNLVGLLPTDSAASDSATGDVVAADPMAASLNADDRTSRSGLPSRTWSRPAGGTYSASHRVVDAANAETAPVLRGAPTADMKRAWLEVAASIYLVAAAVASLWLMLGHVLLARERFAAAAPPAWLYRLLHNAVSSWQGRLPRLVISHRCSRPVSWGVLRPMIALPERICHAANRDQLRTILLHEMGHIRRGDARGNLLFEVAFPLLFFHPLYWWLRAEVRMAAELVADDWAAGQTGKEIYVAELVALARGSSRRRLSFLAGTGVFSSPSQFYRRMQMLLTRENPLTTRPSVRWRIASAAGLAIAVAFAAALAGNRPAVGQQAENAAAKEAPSAGAPDVPKSATVEQPKPEAPGAPSADAKDVASQNLTPPVPVAGAAPAIGVGAAPPAVDVPATPAAEAALPVAVAPAAGTDVRPGGALPSVNPIPNTPLPPPPLQPSPAGGDAATADALRAEKAKLLDEIKMLRAKLHDLGGTEATTAPVALPRGNVLLSTDKIVVLTRADQNGHLIQERWTTDDNGKPSRIIARSEIAGNSPIAAATPGLADGKVAVKMFKDKEGTIWIHAYDTKSGKLIEARQMTVNPAGTALVAPAAAPEYAVSPVPSSNKAPESVVTGLFGDPLTTPPSVAPSPVQPESAGSDLPSLTPAPATSSPWERNANRARHALGGGTEAATPAVSNRPLDLITLANSYADTVGAVELAKAKLAEAEANQKTVPELLPYRAAVASSQRKEKLLRRIAQVATAGAKQEYKRAEELYRTGAMAVSEVSDVKSRLEILEQILNTSADAAPEGGGAAKP